MMMQTTKPAANPLMEIAERIREMREIVGYTETEMAEKTEVSVEQYHSYEQGTVDFPFTFMHKCALAFGVELTDLLEGQSAKLSSYTVTRRGMGPVTASEDGITIQNMAAMFRQKLATPYWVTYQYSKELQGQPIHTTTHAGQEFDLVVKGTLRVRVGEHEEVLHEGDSIFYKSSTPHGMIAVDGQDCVFLAMIMASGEKEQDLSVRTRALEETPEQQLLCDQFVHGVEKEDARWSGWVPAGWSFGGSTSWTASRGAEVSDKTAMVHGKRHDRAAVHVQGHEGRLESGGKLFHFARREARRPRDAGAQAALSVLVCDPRPA